MLAIVPLRPNPQIARTKTMSMRASTVASATMADSSIVESPRLGQTFGVTVADL
jgi:hypothetical protein